MIDERAAARAKLVSIQNDLSQVRSINEFTDSLADALQHAEGREMPKALLRELLSTPTNRALSIGGLEAKRRFLNALTGNIHKFPLQEQQSLAKAWPVKISSEYGNLLSFVSEDGAPGFHVDDDDDDEVLIVAATPAPRPAAPPPRVYAPPATLHAARQSHAALEDLRLKLKALVTGPSADQAQQRLLSDEAHQVVRAADEKRRAPFFADLRLNLFKFSVDGQNKLIARFPELTADIARLLDSMAQEISKWLDEEKLASQRGNTAPLLTKLGNLFKAILSVPFLATFKHIDVKDKKGKEAFLLKVALCLRTCKKKKYAEVSPLAEQEAQLRKEFFFVANYGELMEEWLNGRLSQCNEEFEKRATDVLGTNLSAVLQRLRRVFRPGQWKSLSDSKLLEDLYKLFADLSFPKHVLTTRTIVKVLRKVSSFGAGAIGDFQVYSDIARLPPQSPCYFGPPAQDAIDAKVIEVLQRLPPFPALRKFQSGMFLFGQAQVDFVIQGGGSDGTLLARTVNSEGGQSETSAENFFVKRGTEEFPDAGAMAVQASAMQHPNGPPCTPLEMAGTFLPPPTVSSAPPPLAALPPTSVDVSGAPHLMMLDPHPALGTGDAPHLMMLDPHPALGAGMPAAGNQRYEPYPGAQRSTPVQLSGGPIPCFGVEDDEI